jgi:hypothetical protein
MALEARLLALTPLQYLCTPPILNQVLRIRLLRQAEALGGADGLRLLPLSFGRASVRLRARTEQRTRALGRSSA